MSRRKGGDDGEWIHGVNAVREAVRCNPAGVAHARVERGRRDARIQRVIEQLEHAGVSVERVAREELDRCTDGGVHQGIAIRYRGARPHGEAALEEAVAGAEDPVLLVLDQVQDPHNLGAALRSAAAAGALGVVAPKDRSAGLSGAVFKSAAGALEHVAFYQVTNLARTLERLQGLGVWCVGAAGDAPVSCYGVDLRGPLALVLGGEGRGLRRLTREKCDRLVAIPMAPGMESLNVSVAAGVLLFEARRQRLEQDASRRR